MTPLVRVLRTVDKFDHWLIDVTGIPFPMWAYRVCCAYVRRAGDEAWDEE